MTEHTPGPWAVSKVGLTNLGARAAVYADGRIGTVDAQADVPSRDMWQSVCPQRDANAHIIAASPDLLAVAESVVAWADHQALLFGPQEPLLFVDAARAAIAKAKGV